MSVDIGKDAKRAHDGMAVILAGYNASIDTTNPEKNPYLKFYGDESEYIKPKTVNKQANAKDDIQALTQYMDELEENMDLRRGIIRTMQPRDLAHIGANPETKSDVVIRDARGQRPEQGALKPEDTAEGWVIGAAARARGALKLIEMAHVTTKNSDEAKKDVWTLLEGYREKLEKNLNPESQKKIIGEMDYELVDVLQKYDLTIGGVKLTDKRRKSVEKMLMDARDACNFERDTHPSIVTITRNLAPEGQTISQVITAIPTTPCTELNRSAYFGPTMDTNQPWFKALTESRKDEDKVRAALALQYKDKIADGRHVTPTQLRWLPGTANTYVQDVSYIIDNVHDRERGFVDTRTAVPLHGRGDYENIDALTNHNIAHINVINHDGKFIGLNSDLNTEVNPTKASILKAALGQKEEQQITDGMRNVLGLQFESCPISVSTKDKAAALNKATDILLYGESNESISVKAIVAKFEKMSTVFCKSGKDRTQAALEEAGLRDAHQVIAAVLKKQHITLSKEQKKDISLGVKQACHGETMSGGNGSSRGSFGTKISNVYGKDGVGDIGMPLKEGLILDVKDFAKSTISEITKVKGVKPKMPVLVIAKARKATQEIRVAPDQQQTMRGRSGPVVSRPARSPSGQSIGN